MRALATLILLTITIGAAEPPTAAAIDAIVQAEMKQQTIPGVGVLVLHGGEVRVMKGYGLANVEHQVPVSPETMFQTGSVGKQFTAALALKLVEQGKLALDDSIAKYFADAPKPWHAITVRHLLTHTAGIPDYDDNVDMRKDYTDRELAKVIFASSLEFPPGKRWNYSNTGYALLGLLLTQASGQFYSDAMRTHLFDPAGMTTARIISEEAIVPHRAAGYRLEKGQLLNQEWVSPTFNRTADGSLYLNLKDYLAWAKTLRGKGVLKPESWSAIFTPARLASGKNYPYGFGWGVSTDRGQESHTHGGAWQGFRTRISHHLGDDLVLVALCNSADAEPDRIVDAIATLYNPKLVPTPPTEPIADDAKVTAALRDLLKKAAEKKLAPADFVYVRKGFFDTEAVVYQLLLHNAGDPKKLLLMRRTERGDDLIHHYRAVYKQKAFDVTYGVAPDGKAVQFALAERKAAPK